MLKKLHIKLLKVELGLNLHLNRFQTKCFKLRVKNKEKK